MLSGPTGTAAVNIKRGFFTSCASASNASLSSGGKQKRGDRLSLKK